MYTIYPAVDDNVFHRLEFGGTFIFTLVTTLALVFSVERRFQSPLLLKVLVLVNICASFVAALLVFLTLDVFERVAHEIEYANELCTAVVDVLIVLTLELKGEAEQQCCKRSQLVAFAASAAAFPVLQLVVYNAAWGGERPARYVEFFFNSLSAAISFWFCTDSMFIADRLKLEIMLAPTDLTVVIDAQSRRAVHDHGKMRPYEPPAAGRSPLGSERPCGGCDACAECRGEAPLGYTVTKGILPVGQRQPVSPVQNVERSQLCEPCELPPSLS